MILGLVFSLIFGAIVGSFLNVLILRLPQGQSPSGRSHCVHCGHQLQVLDLFPVFSFIFLRGKCRYCKKAISRRYIYIELLTAALFGICWARLAPVSVYDFILLGKYLFASAMLIVVFAIDYEHFLILDKVIFPSAAILFLFNLALDFSARADWVYSKTLNGLIGALGLMLFFAAIYYFSRGKWIGYGDIKFALALGLITPFPLVIVSAFLAYMVGAAVGIFLLAAKMKNIRSEVPFGTFLSAATFVTMIYGEQILNWYLRVTGLYYL